MDTNNNFGRQSVDTDAVAVPYELAAAEPVVDEPYRLGQRLSGALAGAAVLGSSLLAACGGTQVVPTGPAPAPTPIAAPAPAPLDPISGISTNPLDVVAAARARLIVSRSVYSGNERGLNSARDIYIKGLRAEAAVMVKSAANDRAWAAYYTSLAVKFEAEAKKVAEVDYFPNATKDVSVSYSALASDQLSSARSAYTGAVGATEASKADVNASRDNLLAVLNVQAGALRAAASSRTNSAVAKESEAQSKLERVASALQLGADNFKPAKVVANPPAAILGGHVTGTTPAPASPQFDPAPPPVAGSR